MSTVSVSTPFPIFTDIDGQPLENGYIFIGIANLGPIGNPINVYWDAALTIPAAQPIRTLGGYPINNGTPARLYVNSDYSIQVQNRNGSVVYSAPVDTEFMSSANVSYTPAGTGAVATTVQAKLRESVSVFNFMTTAQVADVKANTASIDVTAAIQTAINSGAGSVYAPSGTYKITTALTAQSNQTIHGDGDKTVVKIYANINGFLLDGVANVTLCDFKIDGNKSTYTSASNNAIYSPANGTGSSNIEIRNVHVDSPAGAGIIFLAQAGSHSNNIRFIDNLVTNTGTHGIICQDYVDDTLIENNRVENFGLLIADRPGITTGRSAARHRVLGNYVRCSPSALGVSVHGISIDNCATFVCNNNIVEDAIGFGIEIGGGTIGSVVGNTIINSANAGIELGGSTLDVVDVTISANVIRNAGAQGIYVINGSAALTQRVAITGNAVYNASQVGIQVDDACTDVSITGNIVVSCVLSGVYVRLSSNLVVMANDVRNNNTAANAAHAGIRVINTVSETSMIIDKNIVTGSGVRDFGIDNPITNKGASDIPIQIFPLATFNPSIANGSVFKTSDTGAIINFTGNLANGEMIRILALHAATIVNGANIKTSTGANKTLTVNVIYTFTYVDGVWYESATV